MNKNKIILIKSHTIFYEFGTGKTNSRVTVAILAIQKFTVK